MSGQEKVERLPVIATVPGFEQLLAVPHIPSCKGIDVSSAVYDTLENLFFDTTSSNTGRLNGAATLLEQRLDRDVLYIACRHHVFEIILQTAIIEAKLFESSGPDIALFKKFKNSWNKIDTTKFSLFNENKKTKEILTPVREEMIRFCSQKLTEDHPRKDYKEFIELVVISFGGTLAWQRE